MQYFVLIKSPHPTIVLDKDGKVKFFQYKEDAEKYAKNYNDAI
jgi:hypothetical protein